MSNKANKLYPSIRRSHQTKQILEKKKKIIPLATRDNPAREPGA